MSREAPDRAKMFDPLVLGSVSCGIHRTARPFLNFICSWLQRRTPNYFHNICAHDRPLARTRGPPCFYTLVHCTHTVGSNLQTNLVRLLCTSTSEETWSWLSYLACPSEKQRETSTVIYSSCKTTPLACGEDIYISI
jgi:hypothetical protein